MTEEVSKEFKDMVARTSELVKKGDFDEILRLFGKLNMNSSDPEFVGAMKMIANGMKAKGNHDKAFKIYQDIYIDLREKCGLVHKETLTAMADVISTTRDASLIFKYLTEGASAAAIVGDEDIITIFSDIRTNFFNNITPTQKRLYLKLESNKKRKATDEKESPKRKQAKTVHDIDELMARFDLN